MAFRPICDFAPPINPDLNAVPLREIVTRIQERQRELDISVSDLARRSGVSRATVIRILGGEDREFSFANLQAILLALGISFDLKEIPAEQFRDQIATKKSEAVDCPHPRQCSARGSSHFSVLRPIASGRDESSNCFIESKAVGIVNSGRDKQERLGLGSSGKEDDTPFDGSGFKLKTVKTRRELNEVEFTSILRVTEKYLLSKPSRKLAPFTSDWRL